MRLSFLPALLLAGRVLAQGAGSPADAPVPVPGDAQVPVSAPQSTSPADAADDLEPKPMGIVDGLMKYAKVQVLGGTMVDVDRRDKLDARDNILRVGDKNWDELMEAANPDDLYVIVLHGQMNDLQGSIPWDIHLNATKEAREISPSDPDALAMSKVHWVRMDYMTEPYTCAKWLVFRPSFFVFATNKGQDLRFLRPNMFPPNGTFFHGFVKSGNWRDVGVWKGSFAPGGSNAWIPEKYIQLQQKLSGVPNIAWIAASGVLSQMVMRWFNVPTGR